jgi:primosomal protein N'
VASNFGGVDQLQEILNKEYQLDAQKIDSKSSLDYSAKAYISTRVFDPVIDYTKFKKIIFIQAENLIASPDYLVDEELHKSLAELFLRVGDTTEVIFDTTNPDLEFFQDILKLDFRHQEKSNPIDWYNSFVVKESLKRDKFLFPPFYNLVLITTQEKSKEKSLQKINSARQYLINYKSTFSNLRFSSVYQAKFLKRKGMFSHHILLKFPKQYDKYFELRQIIKSCSSTYNLQVRLNPRHLF